MIISGGANVYPAEVEGAVVMHPAVVDVAVFGIPDRESGVSVHAAVEVRSPTTEAEIMNFCRERLAHYKCPTSVKKSSITSLVIPTARFVNVSCGTIIGRAARTRSHRRRGPCSTSEVVSGPDRRPPNRGRTPPASDLKTTPRPRIAGGAPARAMVDRRPGLSLTFWAGALILGHVTSET